MPFKEGTAVAAAVARERGRILPREALTAVEVQWYVRE